jgi:hypothetical protein
MTGNSGTGLTTGRCGGMAARRHSRRRAGEQEKLTRAQASGGDGDEVSVLGSAEEVAEGCCQRRGHARAALVRGGSGWRQFRQRGGRSWTGSARGVRGGREEAIGRGNLGGWRGCGESRRGGVAAARCRMEKEKAKQPGRGGLDWVL